MKIFLTKQTCTKTKRILSKRSNYSSLFTNLNYFLIVKKFIFALTLILSPCAANAGQLLPYLYASKFCELAASGVDLNDARKIAIIESTISTGSSVEVNYQGKKVSSDILQAVIVVSKMCPEYMK